MIVNLDSTRDRDAVLANGGKIIGEYSDGWLVEVKARRVGDISYQLPDGYVIRRYRLPVVSGTHEQLARAPGGPGPEASPQLEPRRSPSPAEI